MYTYNVPMGDFLLGNSSPSASTYGSVRSEVTGGQMRSPRGRVRPPSVPAVLIGSRPARHKND